MLAEKPDIVIIATGGLPNSEFLNHGNDLVVSSWDILSGDAKPGNNVLLFDDNGNHPGMQAAHFLAEAGAELETELIIASKRITAESPGAIIAP